MWKWFILFWLTQCRMLLSQPVTNEGTRGSRQLNFDECCPCVNTESNRNFDIMSTTNERAASVDSCPCPSSMDSEYAPSIFTPALRAVEPFIRSAKEKSIKPLLNPEVGLASSVLETLREVTDQEYQEALVRDAARNAFKDTENTLEEGIVNIPKNIVNIILQPKEKYTEDPMPEASHAQETRCIHPNLETSRFKQKKFKPSNNLLKEYLPMQSITNRKKYSDMEKSASNVQERITQPIKSNLLEDLKLKSDLFKMKHFPNRLKSLKDSYADYDAREMFDKSPECDNSRSNQPLPVPNYKLSSVLDLLKTAKQQNNISPLLPITKETNKNEDNDFIFSPSNFKKYYAKNDRTNDVPINEEIQPKQLFHPKEINTHDDVLKSVTPYQFKPRTTSLTKINLKDALHRQNSDVGETMDAVPSPSEISIVANPIDKVIEKTNDFREECLVDNDITKTDEKYETNDIQGQTVIETILPSTLTIVKNDNDDIISKEVEVDNTKNTFDVGDLETGSSNLKKVQIQQEINEKICDNGDNIINETGKQLLNIENSLLPTTEKVTIIRDETCETNKIELLPNTKTSENIMDNNEIIEENLESNGQGSFNSKNIGEGIETVTLCIPTNNKENIKNQDDVSTHDLQKMSDRILNLSLSSAKVAEPVALNSNVITNNLDKSVNNIGSSTLSSFELTEPTPFLSGPSLGNINQKEDILDEVSDKKQDNANNDLVNSLLRKNPCEIPPPKKDKEGKDRVQVEVTSSNDQEKEMMSEASNPFENRIPHNYHNVQSNGNNMKEFMDNFRSSISDIFNNNQEINKFKEYISENGNTNINRNPILTKHNQKLYDDEQPLSESRNIDMVKRYFKTLKGDDLLKSNKNYNLNSFKAKVASPDSLNLKRLPAITNERKAILSKSFNESPLEKPNNYWDGVRNNYNPGVNFKTFSENMKSQADDTLKSIQSSLYDLQKSQTRNQNNIFGKTPTKSNIFQNFPQNDFSKKLQDFNSNIMDRLSVLSQRIQQTNNKMEKMKNIPKFKPDKDINFLKSKQQSKLKPNTQLIKKGSASTQYVQQKFNHPADPIGANLRNIKYSPTMKSAHETKSPLKKDITLKPQKESSITFSFTTTNRPELLKVGSNSKTLNKLTPGSLRPSITLPKSSSLQSPLQKRLELMTKLKNGEPKPLASDRFTSRMLLPDRTLDNYKKLSLDKSMNPSLHSVNDFIDESVNTNTGFSARNDPVGYPSENIVLSTVRDGTTAKSNNGQKSDLMSDAKQSASNNINVGTSSLLEKPLKENVSYKCKMICIEDSSDSK